MTASLAEAIDELYTRFANYRVAEDFAGCAHCVDPRESACLRTTRLKDLHVRDLSRYAFKAISTWGTPDDLKHFIPRLFELVAKDPGDLSVEVLFGKLTDADWLRWPRAEIVSIDAYFDALWSDLLTRDLPDEDAGSADTVLCAIGKARDSVAPLLSRWERVPTSSASRRLAFFVIVNTEHIQRRGQLFNAFWQDRPAQAKEVIQWLSSPAPLQILRRDQAALAGSLHGIPLHDSIPMLEMLR